MRSIFLSFLAALILIPVLPVAEASASDMPGWPKDKVIKFKATRNGDPLGYSILRFEDRGESQFVQVCTVFEVGVGPFSAFIYLLRIDTEWRHGKVVTMSSRVNDDAEVFSVEVREGEGALAYTGAKGQGSVANTILPSTYWRNDLVKATEILDGQYGGTRKIKMTDLGVEQIPVMGKTVSARRWSMRGQLDLDVWYDEATGEWSRLDFTKGDSHVIYERVAPGPNDAAAFVPLSEVHGANGRYVKNIIEQLGK